MSNELELAYLVISILVLMIMALLLRHNSDGRGAR